jgi:hypothetical protein
MLERALDTAESLSLQSENASAQQRVAEKK